MQAVLEHPGRESIGDDADPARGPRPRSRTAWRRRYLLRRLLILVPLAFLATVAAFGLTRLEPGGALASLLNENRPTTLAEKEAIINQYHLNDPFLVQYWHWLGGVVHGDLGRSIITHQTVLSEIQQRIGVTVALMFGAIVLAVVLGITFGALAALHRSRWADRAIVGFGVMGTSTPAFATGIVFLYLFAFRLGWFPLFGEGSGLEGHAVHLALPILVLALHGMGSMMRITRAAMLNQVDQDFVQFARARGLSESRILRRHTLRNALIPVTTAAGLLLVGLLTGSVLVETVFGLPGLGTLLVNSVTNGDFPVIQGLVLMIATWVILVNIAVDMLYAAIDPRVGFEAAKA